MWTVRLIQRAIVNEKCDNRVEFVEIFAAFSLLFVVTTKLISLNNSAHRNLLFPHRLLPFFESRERF